MSSMTTSPDVGALSPQWGVRLEEYPTGLGWSPDGSRLAVCIASGQISLFDAMNGALLWRHPGHTLGALSLSWSADGTLLATGGQDGVCRVWGMDGTPHLALTLPCGDGAWVEHVAYNPLGGTERSRHLLATASGRFVHLWNQRGELARTFGPHDSTVSALQWKPGSQELLSAAYGLLATWQPTTDKPMKRYEWKGSILAIACSPDGRYVGTGDQDNTVHLWQTKTGRDVQMTGYAGKALALSWDGTSRFFATGGSDAITIWNCSKSPAGSRPIVLEGHQDLITALAYQRRGRLLASGARDGEILLWDPSSEKKPIATYRSESTAACVSWAPNDAHLAVGSADGRIDVLAC